VVHWINDGLMTVFFLLIGLELEREIYIGELADLKNASLPIFAAIGGMILPAFLFIVINAGTSTISGAGIPMATDIAFAVGILSLLGRRVPSELKIFLIAFAVADDLGAVLIIAIFYTTSLSLYFLLGAAAVFVLLLVLNRLKIYNLIPYLLGGLVMWYLMLNSGVHASITGVLLAFAIPFGDNSERAPSYRLQHFLHKPVAFLILPVFALANTNIPISGNLVEILGQKYTLGIIAGLVIGKPVGIWLLSFVSIKMGISRMPEGLTWGGITGAGFLGGIGFTMSIFITLLAFSDGAVINNSKIAVLVASLIAAMTGYLLLRRQLKKE
jgi:NhaA family Na+:H+ antiporter